MDQWFCVCASPSSVSSNRMFKDWSYPVLSHHYICWVYLGWIIIFWTKVAGPQETTFNYDRDYSTTPKIQNLVELSIVTDETWSFLFWGVAKCVLCRTGNFWKSLYGTKHMYWCWVTKINPVCCLLNNFSSLISSGNTTIIIRYYYALRALHPQLRAWRAISLIQIMRNLFSLPVINVGIVLWHVLQEDAILTKEIYEKIFLGGFLVKKKFHSLRRI